MKLYIDRSRIITACTGCVILVYLGARYANGHLPLVDGHPSLSTLLAVFIAFGFVCSLFRPAKRELPPSLLKPRPQIWSKSRDQAFDSIRAIFLADALKGSARGIHKWKPTAEDKNNGVLKFNRIVEEPSDLITDRQIIKGEMALTISLNNEEKGNGTSVQLEFEVLHSFTTFTVAEIIGETKILLRRARAQKS